MKAQKMLDIMTEHLSESMAEKIVDQYYYETLTSEVYYDTPSEYSRYCKMLRRCHNPNDYAYENYGARGVYVCDRWRGRFGFKNFCDDMGVCPPGMSLERKDVDKGYSPHNCRWATQEEQVANRRGFGQIKLAGISQTPNGYRARVFNKGKAIFDKHYATQKQAVEKRNEFIVKNNLPHKLN